MSGSDNSEETHDFLGFSDQFTTLAQEHENNIYQAIRRYSILQGLDATRSNQGIVASTPQTTPIGTPVPTPQVTPINTPVGSPRSNLRTDNFQLTRLASTSSEPVATNDISLSIDTLPVRSAISLQNIHLDYLSPLDRTNMSYQAFDRALRAYTKIQKAVIKITAELRTAVQNNRGEFEIEELLASLEVEKEDMNKKGKIVNDFDISATNTSHMEEEWQDEWNKTDKQATTAIKLGSSWMQRRAHRAVPTSDVVKHEKLQIEPFDGDPMIWSFWMANAKKVIDSMCITDQRFWLKQKIKGAAREFIGNYDLEQLSIAKIFERLDSRYGQPHMKVKKVALAIKDMVVLDESATITDIDRFWNRFMNIAGECDGLKLTAQNLTIILTMLHLPPRFRERLESKMRETKEDYKFTREDTMIPYSLVREEMLSLYPENNHNHSFATSTAITNQDNTTGEGTSYRRPIFTNGSRGQGRGRIQTQSMGQQQYLSCIYCNGSHSNRDCYQYDTPQKRRDRLVAIDRCRACMIRLSLHEAECNQNAVCFHHPGEKHWRHLCDGPEFTHPGKQTMATGQA